MSPRRGGAEASEAHAGLRASPTGDPLPPCPLDHHFPPSRHPSSCAHPLREAQRNPALPHLPPRLPPIHILGTSLLPSYPHLPSLARPRNKLTVNPMDPPPPPSPRSRPLSFTMTDEEDELPPRPVAGTSTRAAFPFSPTRTASNAPPSRRRRSLDGGPGSLDQQQQQPQGLSPAFSLGKRKTSEWGDR